MLCGWKLSVSFCVVWFSSFPLSFSDFNMLFLCNTSARYHANSFIIVARDQTFWQTRITDTFMDIRNSSLVKPADSGHTRIRNRKELQCCRQMNKPWIIENKRPETSLLFVWLIVSWSTSFCLIRNKIWFVTWDRKLVAFILLVELTFSCDLAYPFLWLTRLWIYYGIQGLLRFTK